MLDRSGARNCTLCKLHTTAQYVGLLGTGPEPCEVMIIGEAPGYREDDSGKPFVGKAGQLLDSILDAAGLPRSQVFISNAVHCRPPGNRTPSKSEIRTCKHWLNHELTTIRPKYALLLGNVPLLAITGKGGITKRRGKPFEQDGIIYLPTFHPAFILRDERNRPHLEADVEAFASIVKGKGIPREEGLDYSLVTTIEQLIIMLDDIISCGEASFDIETTCLYPWQKDADINTIGFGTATKQYIIRPTANDVHLIDKTLRRHKIKLIAQNGKFDCLWMWVHYDVQWQDFLDFDTMLAHYLLDENSPHDLKYLSRLFLGAPDYDLDKTDKIVFSPQLVHYQAHDLYYTYKLKPILLKRLRQDSDLYSVFNGILMPCARLFVEVEYDGLYIDLKNMGAAERYLRREMKTAETQMRKYGDINFASTQQLAKLLFNDLGLDVVERTPKGAASTNESVLKRIDHPVATAILRFRAAKQQLSFFIEGWKPFLDGPYLHPSFKLHGTVTGRLSSEHPNAQQIPRDERIRSLITAPPGWTLVEADLSQIELRIAAMLANERNMLSWFHEGRDVHWAVALKELGRGAGEKDLIMKTARVIRRYTGTYHEALDVLLEAGPDAAIAVDKRWKELRKKAKAVDFGYIFGMWWKKFKIYARDNYGLTLTDTEAMASRKFFFDTFPDIAPWHDRQCAFARRHGYVRSLSGRKRRLPDAQAAQDTPARGEAERQAINSPVQSFANELNLMAAIQLRQEFSRGIVRICATVHDAILLRVKNKEVAKVTQRLLKIMSHPKLLDIMKIKVTVPVVAEAKLGPWGKGVSLDKYLQS